MPGRERETRKNMREREMKKKKSEKEQVGMERERRVEREGERADENIR